MNDKQSRNSLTLKVNVNGSSGNGITSSGEVLERPKELYKPIPEDNVHPSWTVVTGIAQDSKDGSQSAEADTRQTTVKLENGDSKMVQEENTVNDGADEQMLGTEDSDKLAGKREEVKFIKGDHLNGDAKIDIGAVNGKAFTGMTKDELMKYANDPFWVRLRWIFFIGFWAIWVLMLVGAVFIIIDAPKCAAPKPLPWYKQGLLAKFESFDVGSGDVASAQKLQATGAIYELPAELTYSVSEPEVEQKIKDIVATYKESKVHVILDITPNYVKKDSLLMRNALADESKRSAFVWIEKPEVPNNWLSTVNGSAWSEVTPGNFVLSQFGDGLYDLHMNDTIVKQELGGVFKHLMELGVKGFRLKNTKFYLLSKTIQDEVPSNDPNYIHTQYGFWTHTQTTFQDGLGDVLYEYLAMVKNVSDEAFLSVSDDIVRPEVYQTSTNDYGIDIPIYGHFVQALSSPQQDKPLHQELLKTMRAVGNHTWLQWNFATMDADSDTNPSAFGLFMSLLPGVPVVPVNSAAFVNISSNTYKHIEQLRLSHSYMHGELEMYDAGQLVAYSRIKSGNPGYFVAFNPTDVAQKSSFGNLGLPDKMTVDIISDNYNVTDISVKSKVMTDQLEVSPFATIILTYVPVKSG